MFINLNPIIKNRDYRYLFLGQTISFFGSMMTYVAIPYQIYLLTKNSFLVGLLGVFQLVPLVISGLYGGALADTMDRRKMLLTSEFLLVLSTVILTANCFLEKPSVVLLFIVAALSSVFIGFHRPAMEAMTPQIVSPEDYPAVAALGSMRYAIAAVSAPALGGWLISQYGIQWTYGIDAITYIVSLFCLMTIRKVAIPQNTEKAGWDSIRKGFTYACSQPVILGTYIVDIVAMIFAMPMALYPALSEGWGGAKAAGWLYAAIPMGAFVSSLFSGLASKVKRQGAGVILSALVWGIFIILLAFADNLFLAVTFLALAGVADSLSGIYRQTIWNNSIPDNYRGRLAGLNMLSYMIGPLLGNARAGFMASISSNYFSILSGGILCVIGCSVLIKLLPDFWSYKSQN